MTIVTRQNLLAEKTRYAISVGGIALAVFLISFLLSLFQGWNLQVGRYIELVDADVWVARDGTTSFLAAASILPEETRAELQQVQGVEQVDALVVRPMQVVAGGVEEGNHLVGYEVGGAGGPPSIRDGKDAPGPDEVILDNAFKARTGADIGDTYRASGRDLEVVGISGGGNFVFSQTSFVSIETAQDLLAMEGLATFYLVHISDGEDPQVVAERVEAQNPALAAFTSEEFAHETRSQIMDNIIPILIVVLVLAFIVGVAITGLTIYNATVEKQREFGILKAIGFTNTYLYRVVLEQSLVTGLLGFGVGVGLTAVATRFVVTLVPQFVTVLRWEDVLLVLGTTLLMSLVAGILPVRRIAGVDPVAVFSG